MHVMAATGAATPPAGAQLAVSWAALETPFPVGQADHLAVSWAALEIQNQQTGLAFTTKPSGGVTSEQFLNNQAADFAWGGAPSGTTYWTRYMNEPWANVGTATSTTFSLGDEAPVPRTFQVYAAPSGQAITHTWKVIKPLRNGDPGQPWRILVVPITWPGGGTYPASSTDLGTVAQRTSSMDQMKAAIAEYSRNQVALTYTLANPLAIAALTTTSTAVMSEIVTKTRAAATAAGYNLSNFDTVCAVGNAADGSTFDPSGLAQLGPNQRDNVTVNGFGWSTYGQYVLTHENTHCVGFAHSGRYQTPYTNSSSDVVFDYGDDSSVMGDGALDNNGDSHTFHPDPWHKILRNWITPNVVTANGTYTISSTEQASPANPQALLIRLANQQVFVVDLRQATGFDTALGDTTNVTPAIGRYATGVLVHNKSTLIDTEPGTSALSRKDWGVEPGETWTLPNGTLAVTCVSKTASTATVTISGLPPATPGA